MNELERRTTFGLEVRGEEDKPMIRGYFSPFNSLSEKLGFFKERMLPGAFSRSIKQNGDILAFDWHNKMGSSLAVLGSTQARTFRLKEDGQGLYGEIDPPATSYARDLVANMKAGNVRGASIGFMDVKGGVKWSQEDGVDVRSLSDLNLRECTITAVPAYRATALVARDLLGADVEEDKAILICRALNRVQHSLDVVDEDREVLREYRSQLKQHDELIEKLLGAQRTIMRPSDVLKWVELNQFGEERTNKPGNAMPYGDVHYADPGYQSDKKKRYPLDTPEHIKAAWDYIHHGNDKGQYTAAQSKSIEAAIVAAWKEKIDSKGPPEADDK